MNETASFTVSDSAAKQIGQILAQEETKSFLRVSVSGGGCSGFQYGFTIDDARTDDDQIVAKGGIEVVIDSTSLMYMEGSEIDYVNDLIGASFQVKNPNAASSCGCGTSFSI